MSIPSSPKAIAIHGFHSASSRSLLQHQLIVTMISIYLSMITTILFLIHLATFSKIPGLMVSW
jgi:hypothetical protein